MKIKNVMIGVAVSLIGLGIFLGARQSNAEALNNSANDSLMFRDLLSNQDILLIGDSQVGRNLGKSLIDLSDELDSNITTFFKEGTTPRKILDDDELLSEMIKKIKNDRPSLIMIQLGDNGISSSDHASRLIDVIRDDFSGLIIWIGAHPVSIPKSKSPYVFVDDKHKSEFRHIDNYNKLKSTWNDRLLSQLEDLNDVIYFDPILLYPTGSYNVNDMSQDGIHLDKEASVDFLKSFLDFGDKDE